MRKLQALVAPKPPQGVIVRGHAGLVIDKLSFTDNALGALRVPPAVESEFDTHKTVEARFWAWLELFSVRTVSESLILLPPRSKAALPKAALLNQPILSLSKNLKLSTSGPLQKWPELEPLPTMFSGRCPCLAILRTGR